MNTAYDPLATPPLRLAGRGWRFHVRWPVRSRRGSAAPSPLSTSLPLVLLCPRRTGQSPCRSVVGPREEGDDEPVQHGTVASLGR